MSTPSPQSRVPADGLLEGLIRDIPDFPKPGITFRDITPLLGDAPAFREAVDRMTAPFAGPITKVIGDRGARLHPGATDRARARRRLRAGA